MRYYVTLPSQQELPVDVTCRPDGSTEVAIEGQPVAADAVEADGALSVRVGHRVLDLWLEGEPPDLRFVATGLRMSARVQSEQARATAITGHAESATSEVSSPMPGRVVKLLVEPGDEVEAGAAVVVVEAMKMENELCADRAGKVEQICVEVGQHVDGGEPLVKLG